MIYLDHAATTKLDPAALEAMLPYLSDEYGNPSAVYSKAAKARAAIDSARDRIAVTIGSAPREIYFTSGGTEADNWALTMTCEAAMASHGTKITDQEKDRSGISSGRFIPHIITSSVEHHAVLHTCRFLEQVGVNVTYLPVDAHGRVDPEDAAKALRPETVLISIMTANNEVGTIEPVREIAEIAHAHGVLLHTDAVQAYGHIPVNVREMGADLLSASAHKLGGPKGVGFLYIKNGVRIRAFHHGGAQERGRRAGTENVPGIVGFAKAAEIAAEHLAERKARTEALRDELIRLVLAEIPGAYLLGDPKNRLPGNVDFVIPGCDTQTTLIRLDRMGICASGGSACSAGSLEPSHVLLACGVSEEDASCALRLTLGHENTEEEVRETVQALTVIARGK